MARYNLNRNNLPPIVKEAIKKIGFEEYSFKSISQHYYQGAQRLYACDEALRIISEYEGEIAARQQYP